MSTNHFFVLALQGDSFCKNVYCHCTKKEKKAALLWVQISCHLFSKNFRHWHRFSVASHFSAYLSHSFRNNHILQQRMQIARVTTWEFEGLSTQPVSVCIRLWQPPACFSARNKSLLTSREGSEDTLDRRPLESAVLPLFIFPTPQSKTVQVLWGAGRPALIKHQQQVRTQAAILGCSKADKVDPYHRSSSTDAAFPSQEGWTVYVQAAARGWT